MVNFTLKQLRYFEAVARHGHFGRAAEACAISQPALSVQIRELENALGAAVFDRTPRQVRLTGFGEQCAQQVRAILREVDALGDLARTAGDLLSGRLRLGVIPTVAPYLLPALIGDLGRSHPGLDIHVRETVTPGLIAELAEGRIDAAIVALPISEPSLVETPIFAESFKLVRHLSERDKPVPNGETLRRMRLLLLEEGHCFRDQALSFCHVGHAVPREGLDGSSLTTLVQMVGAGIGVTLIPDMAVAVETRSAPVCVAAFPDPQPSRTVGMIWRKTNPLADQLMQLADIVQQSVMTMRNQQMNTDAADAHAGVLAPLVKAGQTLR
ncbi:LysR substrate-binding domain-containing protein [Yoonia sp.]|uniref:LysR substrate-binding domain-containing protein n=1 Tax=Yoonia sp. TaxID=2212373 RepID=UPI0019EA79D8|nr:LysR substrate-binding domain-containing protein [Yoonia sp.]MBE0413966.1 LysR family transcriptional regulator [Yoonia sp.]